LSIETFTQAERDETYSDVEHGMRGYVQRTVSKHGHRNEFEAWLVEACLGDLKAQIDSWPQDLTTSKVSLLMLRKQQHLLGNISTKSMWWLG
jgi:hypothetical protein